MTYVGGAVDNSIAHAGPLTHHDGAYQVRDEFAPHGAARFVELVDDKYYDGMALHRVVEDICMGFGIARELELRRKWMGNAIPDDPSAEPGLAGPRIPFVRGVVSFAGSGPDSRDVNLIIPYRYLDYMGNVHGDAPWEVPIGCVVVVVVGRGEG